MINNNAAAWNNQDNDPKDFDNITNSFAGQNDDAFATNELEDDELKEDEGDGLKPASDPDDLNDVNEDDNDLEPTFDQDDLNDEDEDGDDLTDGGAYNNDPDEMPEKQESENEGSGYHTQTEVNQPQTGADTSYSEQNDVTPPERHEFPSTGPAKTDFESRPQGRTTGRMLGHEPGTEGI